MALDAPSFPARLVEQPEAVNAIDPQDGVTPHVHARLEVFVVVVVRKFR